MGGRSTGYATCTEICTGGAIDDASAGTDNRPMNPLLSRLQPYPFERLRQLFAGVTPNPAYRPISLGIGEPKHPTPALHQAGAGAAWTLGTAWPATRRPPASRSCARPSPAGCSAATALAVDAAHAGAAGQRLARGPVRVRPDGDRPDAADAGGGLPQSVLPDLRRRGPAGRAPSPTTRPATRRATSPSTGTACRPTSGRAPSCCTSARPATPPAP